MLLNRGYDVALFGGIPRIRLIEPGAIRRPDLVTFARAQLSGVASTALGSDDATYSEAAADVPRFWGAGRRLRIEGQRTDSIRNSRGDGAAAGTPGTLPTNWAGGTGTGVTRQVVGSGTDSGLPYVDIRWSGTGGQAAFEIAVDAASSAVSQTWVWSVFLKLVAGSISANNTVILRLYEYDGSSNPSTSVSVGSSIASSLTRLTASRTNVQSGTSQQLARIAITPPAGSWDFTLRIAAPQLEQASFASTPILSPAGATRGADLVTATRESLFPSRRGVLLWSGSWGQNAPSGVDQMALQVDDGTANNRVRVRNAGGGATVVAGRVTGGSAVDATTLGSMTAGAQTSLGLAFDLDAGVYKAMLRGGSVQSGSGGPTSASTVRLGTDSAGASAMFGDTGYWDAIPGIYPSDALLAQWVNSLQLAA